MLLMDKLLLFALGITCLTVVLLYIYVKNKFEAYSHQIDLLFNVYQKLAAEITHGPVKMISTPISCGDGMCSSRPIIVSDDDSDDSDDSCSVDSDDSDDTEELETFTPEVLVPDLQIEKIIILKQEDEVDDRSVEEIKISKLDTHEIIEQLEEEKEEKKNYSKLTIKDLKQLISDMNGPSNLKTKQEMVQFLENS